MSDLNIDTLASGTIPQIKAWAKTNNYRYPSGLKKADAIRYLEGVHLERSSAPSLNPSENKEQVTSNMKLDNLIPKYADFSIEWIEHLNKYGWAVVPIQGWDPEFVNMFFNWFENCNSDFKRNDETSWKAKNITPLLHGILKHYFGHTELQWRIRELCVPIFEKIWNISGKDLLCSFDGGCFMKVKKSDKSKSWFHVDQSRDQKGFACVQGVVNFVDNGPRDGGLVLVQDSRDVFDDYMKNHPSEGITWGPIDMGDPLLKNKKILKICAPAGSIILWDSRTVHCNTPPVGDKLTENGGPRFRMAIYVSMQPRMNATPKELKKRIELYEKGRMTGHSCYGHYFKANPEHPRSYGGPIVKPDKIEIAELNPTRRRLIGYE